MNTYRASLTAILLFIGFVGASAVSAQILRPVSVTTDIPTKSAKVGDVVEVFVKATIKQGWYMYSVAFEDCGPIPFAVTLEKHPSFELVGSLTAIHDKTKHDDIFDCDVKYFENTAEFVQKIKILSTDLTLTGTYEGQACSTSCVPIDGDLLFEPIQITGGGKAPAATEPKGATPDKRPEQAAAYPIPTNELDTTTSSASATEQVAVTNDSTVRKKNKGPILNPDLMVEEEESSLWGYMIVAFFLGITSLVTPCVFPMIPMTVTFFLKDGQTRQQGIRKALIFGGSVILIYTVVGTVFSAIFGSEGLNALATHWFPNLLIFVLFIVFALSFLGLFEINAPHQLVNRADRAAEKGGLGGVFFMAATLVLVSFSCTIPLVGNVLVLAAGGQFVKPIAGMFAYSFAYAIPFTLFAMFPEWLKSLPKSGGWLNTVKVTLGLIELALALKFFSIADQTYHWGILDRDVNIAIWVVVFTILGFYFLGKIRMKSDSIIERITVGRLLLAIGTFSFVVYLVPGLWGAPLKALAGYLPPLYTHDFDLISSTRPKDRDMCGEPKYGEFLHLPHNLSGYFDYDQAIECARAQNKPLFIDFTGHGCTNCREMEAVVWSDPKVLEQLRKDFVVAALYVDDKTELPESEWYTSSHDDKLKKTLGKRNADLQATNLDTNAQPFYVIVGKDETVLVKPFAYNKDVDEFSKFLKDAKKKYKELYP